MHLFVHPNNKGEATGVHSIFNSTSALKEILPMDIEKKKRMSMGGELQILRID